MELGADVLVNTAIAVAGNQINGRSFWAVIAGRKAYEARLGQQ
jgi:thiazole synthase ThiGH ThiG subunit